jgi:hypothetical protein
VYRRRKAAKRGHSSGEDRSADDYLLHLDHSFRVTS